MAPSKHNVSHENVCNKATCKCPKTLPTNDYACTRVSVFTSVFTQHRINVSTSLASQITVKDRVSVSARVRWELPTCSCSASWTRLCDVVRKPIRPLADYTLMKGWLYCLKSLFSFDLCNFWLRVKCGCADMRICGLNNG